MNILHLSPKNASQTNGPQRALSLFISIRGVFSGTLVQWLLPNHLNVHLPIHFRGCSVLSLMDCTVAHYEGQDSAKWVAAQRKASYLFIYLFIYFCCSYTVTLKEIDPDVSAFPVKFCRQDYLMSVFSLIYEVKQHSQHTTASDKHDRDWNMEIWNELHHRSSQTYWWKTTDCCFKRQLGKLNGYYWGVLYGFIHTIWNRNISPKAAIHNSPSKKMLVPAFLI